MELHSWQIFGPCLQWIELWPQKTSLIKKSLTNPAVVTYPKRIKPTWYLVSNGATTPFSSNFYDPLKTIRPWKAPHFLFFFFRPFQKDEMVFLTVSARSSPSKKCWNKYQGIPSTLTAFGGDWDGMSTCFGSFCHAYRLQTPELKFLYMPFFEVAISWKLGCDCKGWMWNY